MADSFDPKERSQVCRKCGEVLYVSDLVAAGSDLRGVDYRNGEEGHDETGPFIRCRKCGAKHDVEDTRVLGKGVQRRFVGLRT